MMATDFTLPNDVFDLTPVIEKAPSVEGCMENNEQISPRGLLFNRIHHYIFDPQRTRLVLLSDPTVKTDWK